MRDILKYSVLVALFLSPSFVFANVSFSEIMYDLKTGGDTDREWVEILNGGSSPVNISDWRFFEGDTNHKFTTSSDGILERDEYAVIVSDEAKFKIDNPSYAGKIFQSSFSLSNTGESLELRTSALATIDSVSYTSSMGANGDGNSLQKIDGIWKAGAPTPGKQNQAPLGNSTQKTETSQQTESSSGIIQASSSVTNDQYRTQFLPYTPIVSRITAYAGESRTVVVGSRVVLDGEARGTNSEDLPFAKYSWNMGDGETAEGKTIAHTYYYPGEYVATLDVENGMYTAQSRITITVTPVDVIISKVGTDDVFVEIKNNSKNEVDLSGWILRRGDISFVFPKGTFLRVGKNITIPSRITKFVTGETPTYLSYADDTKVSVFGKEPIVEKVTQKINTDTTHIGSVLSKHETLPVYSKTDRVVNEDDSIAANSQQIASVGSLPSGKRTDDGGMFWGLIGVCLVVLVAIYAVLESQQKGFPVREKGKNESDKYTILDIES